MPYSGGQPLHVSELELPDHPGSKEVRIGKGRWGKARGEGSILVL